MSLIHAIPENLRSVDEREEFKKWLIEMPMPVKYKKYVLIDWAKFNFERLTPELFKEFGIE